MANGNIFKSTAYISRGYIISIEQLINYSKPHNANIQSINMFTHKPPKKASEEFLLFPMHMYAQY
jgi:hypothetical protein